VDPRAGAGAEKFIGVRFQFIPEYAGIEGDWQAAATEVRDKLEKMQETIMSRPEIAAYRQQEYDTVVFKRGEGDVNEGASYDDTGPNPSALGTRQVQAWRERYFESVAAKAIRRSEREVSVEQHNLPAGEQTDTAPAAGAASERSSPVKVTMFDRDVMGFGEREVIPTHKLLNQINAERRNFDTLIACLTKS
jgi:hypothetical protein